MRDRLERMGPINPMAMEAYEEIGQRHKFITDQKQDLLTAKETLLSTIDEIDTAARETFLGAFNNIQVQFHSCFFARYLPTKMTVI